MFSVLRIFVACLCVHFVFGRPRHTVEKRWAYIENGDPQMRSIHTDCKKIVREYSDGDMPFYEYKAKMRKCMDRQQRTNIPSYEDMDEFTPSFKVPAAQTAKRFETPRNFQQQGNDPYQNYAYNYNYNSQYQDQNAYGTLEQRASISSPQQYPAQQQAQAFPANYNYYQQTQPEPQMTTRSEIPSYPQEPTMYDTDIVKKDVIPKPDEH
ncbi:uncharacterized protein LOC114518140 [Dendronephthya gigantea]|uniref:uncharacterized protein LOC114518140 n=1 Tax=Dendronephthya gigantea TaxID=151771 RepID=UPI00106A3B09|nr:uncharacterized protein LOC114518140 [Dendronephthya gigantea]